MTLAASSVGGEPDPHLGLLCLLRPVESWTAHAPVAPCPPASPDVLLARELSGQESASAKSVAISRPWVSAASRFRCHSQWLRCTGMLLGDIRFLPFNSVCEGIGLPGDRSGI